MVVSTIDERFWAKVKKTARCWIWTGYCNQDGYGRISFYGKPIPAHILSWKMANGNVPEGVCVCHKCDNPPCVRPDHLFLGTQLENIMDRDKKNRTGHGVKNRHAKLSPESVIEMRAMRDSGVIYRDIGERFHVTNSAAWKAVNGANWRRVK